MAYVDYEFYTESFYGSAVPEDVFEKWAELASDRIDMLTFDRLTHNYPTDETAQKKIKKAVCAVAETLYQIDVIRQAAIDAAGVVTNSDGTVTSRRVTGVSSGTESITFSSGSTSSRSETSVYESAAADSTEEDSLVSHAAWPYLNGVRDSAGTLVLYGGF